jgi:hypothetical protein
MIATLEKIDNAVRGAFAIENYKNTNPLTKDARAVFIHLASEYDYNNSQISAYLDLSYNDKTYKEHFDQMQGSPRYLNFPALIDNIKHNIMLEDKLEGVQNDL